MQATGQTSERIVTHDIPKREESCKIQTLWGWKITINIYTLFSEKCQNLAQKVYLENFRPKCLTMGMLISKLPLIFIV